MGLARPHLPREPAGSDSIGHEQQWQSLPLLCRRREFIIQSVQSTYPPLHFYLGAKNLLKAIALGFF